jgi:Domain of unknown function (DUF4158)
MRRQQLTEAQITALVDPPRITVLLRHYTLSAADLAAVRRCRGDHNRLSHAVMLCFLRYPGRPLKAGERSPLPNASIDAALAAIGRLETVADARELMAPFAEHHGKDAVEACLDWPSPNGMLPSSSAKHTC